MTGKNDIIARLRGYELARAEAGDVPGAGILDRAVWEIDRLRRQLKKQVIVGDNKERKLQDRNAEIARLQGHLQWVADQHCTRAALADDGRECSDVSGCVTEWCLPCYATAALAQADDESKGKRCR